MAEPQSRSSYPLYSLLLLTAQLRPGLAGDLANLGNMLSGIATSVQGMQTSMEVFHNTVRYAANGKTTGKATTPPADDEPGGGLKESVKNLEALFARMKNHPEGP